MFIHETASVNVEDDNEGVPLGELIQPDFFLVNAADPSLRDNRDVMEYPFLSLQKQRIKPIEYSENGININVTANPRFSLATIWDWDLIIYATSHLSAAIEAGLTPSPRVRFVPYDCLQQIGRGTSGRHYHELANAIRRLFATSIVTNVRFSNQPEQGAEMGFAWLTRYQIPKRYKVGTPTPDNPDGEPDPKSEWEIELPSWLYNAVLSRKDVLSAHPKYFLLIHESHPATRMR